MTNGAAGAMPSLLPVKKWSTFSVVAQEALADANIRTIVSSRVVCVLFMMIHHPSQLSLHCGALFSPYLIAIPYGRAGPEEKAVLKSRLKLGARTRSFFMTATT